MYDDETSRCTLYQKGKPHHFDQRPVHVMLRGGILSFFNRTLFLAVQYSCFGVCRSVVNIRGSITSILRWRASGERALPLVEIANLRPRRWHKDAGRHNDTRS